MTITVDALVSLASRIAASPDVTFADVRELATGVLDVLGEGSSCGFEAPEVVPWSTPPEATHGVRVPASWATEHLSDDARALARMLLRSADEADNV